MGYPDPEGISLLTWYSITSYILVGYWESPIYITSEKVEGILIDILFSNR